MKRGLAVLVLAAGCGSVDAPPVDTPTGFPDVLTGSLRQGCVLALHMDEDKWTGAPNEVVDACGGDNPGTLRGTANTVATGVKGRAGDFSGSACIDIPDANVLHGINGLTMSAWIYPKALNATDSNGVISKRTAMGNMSEYNLYVWTRNHAWVDLDNEMPRIEGNTAIANDAWTQITMVYDGTKPEAQRVRMYINEKLDLTTTDTKATLTAYTSTLHIGCMPTATIQQNFIGQLDEVVIWNRALSEAELALWYNNTKPQ